MEKFREMLFDLGEIKADIASTSPETAIYIGSDSKCFTKGRGEHWCVYVTVVIIHKDSHSGAKIYKQFTQERDYGDLRPRLMKEVEYAINTGYELVDVIGNRPFQIHLDINPDPKYASNVVVREAMGWVMGMFGFNPQVKPEAFAASAVSDRWAVLEAQKHKKRYRRNHYG